MKAPEIDIVRFADEQRLEASNLRSTIESAIDRVNSAESTLERNYAELGSLLLRVGASQYWRLWDFPSWRAYLLHVRERVHKGRTQMYECIGIARKLLPIISESDLAKMGITKAKELKRLVTATGSIPRLVLAKAIDETVTVDDLRAEIFRATNIAPQYPGEYYDLGGFYATKEERAELFDYAFDLARRTDPVVPREGIPEWAQRKQIIERLCQEYIGTYGPLVEGQHGRG